MICPLARQGMGGAYEVDCKEKKCAWWCKDAKQCAILTIAMCLDGSQYGSFAVSVEDSKQKRGKRE